MKRAYSICLFLCLTPTFFLSQSNPVPPVHQTAGAVSPINAFQADSKADTSALDRYGRLPLSFEANRGQTDRRVKFLSRTSGYSLFLTGDEAVFALSGSKADTKKTKTKIAGSDLALPPGMAAPKAGGVLRMNLLHANAAAKVTGEDELPGTSNYFIGNEPAKWRTNVPTYAKVKYEGIYSGIDLVYYGTQRQLEYDFIVAPGADPRRIAFDVRGAKRVSWDEHGDLVLKMEVGEGEIRLPKPVVYQKKENGARQQIAARYAITGTNRVGFEVADYDASRPLYIDPLVYSTYLGGSSTDLGYGIAVDSAGNAYVTGYTYSADFPTKDPLHAAYSGAADVFVSKLNAAGALVYSTYLGGAANDYGSAIVVDSAGNAYVTGSTNSVGFPTVNALQPTNAGGFDAFVSKISPTGSALVYSTYLGGSGIDQGYGIAVDSAGNAYVTGITNSTDFPTENPLQPANAGGYDAFVFKISPTGSALVFSTYLGGGGLDEGTGIAVDNAGNAYIIGSTSSTNFPTMNALQPANGGPNAAFVTKLNSGGTALVYSTYLGGSGYDSGGGIAVDGAGNTYVAGQTSSADFPTKNPLQPAYAGSGDAFVTKLNSGGTALVYSTYLGGSGNDYSRSITVDNSGNAYVTGLTCSTDFPTKNPVQAKYRGGTGQNCGDAFVSELNPAGSALFYSTYLGGRGIDQGSAIAADSAGNAYVTGYTDSTSFPTRNPLQAAYGGNYDAFVAKIDTRVVTTTTLSSSSNPSAYGQPVNFTAVVSSNDGAPPDGETVMFIKGAKVWATGTLSGGSATFTTSTLSLGNHVITAVYAGDSNFGASTSKAVKQVVNKATTTTSLASSQNPSKVGLAVTFTASVTPEFSGAVKGTVTFYDGTTALKTVTLIAGTAQFTTSKLTSGMHSITATYNGTPSLSGSSDSLTQTVQP